jgi:hypothetical protein
MFTLGIFKYGRNESSFLQQLQILLQMDQERGKGKMTERGQIFRAGPDQKTTVYSFMPTSCLIRSTGRVPTIPGQCKSNLGLPQVK